MEFGSSGGRTPETEPMWASSPGPRTLGACPRGPGSTAVRVVFSGVILVHKCEDLPISAQLFAGCFLRSRGHWAVVGTSSSARQS